MTAAVTTTSRLDPLNCPTRARTASAMSSGTASDEPAAMSSSMWSGSPPLRACSVSM